MWVERQSSQSIIDKLTCISTKMACASIGHVIIPIKHVFDINWNEYGDNAPNLIGIMVKVGKQNCEFEVL